MSMFEEPAWEERYRSRPAVWSKDPNPQLVAEAAELPPGTALDVGCGEGADARWLAGQGWRVVAADFSATALQRAAAAAEASDAEVAGRISWQKVDLRTEPPTGGPFDLVSAQFLQLPPAPRADLFRRLAALVRPGGVLLVVGHAPSDLETGVRRPPIPEAFYTADEVGALLNDAAWEILVAEARPRQVPDAEGRPVTVHDTVLTARRKAS